MNETKQYSKYKVFRPLNEIEEDNKTCNIYLEQRRTYRLKYKEEIRVKAKQYYETNKEEFNDKQKLKAECPVYKCMVRSYIMKRHGQSIKH